LGGIDVELNELNLQELLGKDSDSFPIPVKIAQNGCSVVVSALMDTGANGFAFIDTNLATLICQRFGIQATLLGAECAVKGYNGQAQQPITHADY
jgi:predicted aspartyl protease